MEFIEIKIGGPEGVEVDVSGGHIRVKNMGGGLLTEQEARFMAKMLFMLVDEMEEHANGN